ncbi:hypothetical protein Nepgr_007850 [Nepenthes gracilis]|uniref:Uncharacterized protein n=1 Tax=Nepenthes gracilis TaxID=150966 RepID=A0AAD3S7M4_NEPGR|nr:hypothetical protein Nepgr_007850 [Nepenthes gracilis]
MPSSYDLGLIPRYEYLSRVSLNGHRRQKSLDKNPPVSKSQLPCIGSESSVDEDPARVSGNFGPNKDLGLMVTDSLSPSISDVALLTSPNTQLSPVPISDVNDSSHSDLKSKRPCSEYFWTEGGPLDGVQNISCSCSSLNIALGLFAFAEYGMAEAEIQCGANQNAKEKLISFHFVATCPDHCIDTTPTISSMAMQDQSNLDTGTDVHYSDGGISNVLGSKQEPSRCAKSRQTSKPEWDDGRLGDENTNLKAGSIPTYNEKASKSSTKKSKGKKGKVVLNVMVLEICPSFYDC